MTNLRTAAQQALEAMRRAVPTGEITLADWMKANHDLEAALAEHDKKIVWVEERKAHWAEQLQLARETQERERQQREEAALAEPVQEPVAWLAPRNVDSYSRPDLGYETCSKTDYGAFPVYAAPPQRKPLTEEEIKECERQAMVNGSLPFEQRVFFARAIERAHGIGGDK